MAPTCRRPIRREEANIILKLHSFFSKEKESGSPILMNRPRKRICQAVDISQRSLTRSLAGSRQFNSCIEPNVRKSTAKQE